MATTAPTTGEALVATVTRALAGRDVAALADCYAPDATFLLCNVSNPPAAPLRLTGRAAIHGFIAGIPPDVVMSVEDHSLIGADGRVALVTSCRFPQGGQACDVMVLTLDADGRIADQQVIEVSDG